MKWEMEIQEVEAVIEKVWDLHDKLSDAIHSISITHFSKSFNPNKPNYYDTRNTNGNGNGNGFVFVKDYDKESAIFEARSLNCIRSALENLQDHLQFFHTVQMQQRAERDAALAQLEQSRLILALRLAEHRGKSCKVIDEAMDLIGDARDPSGFVSLENLSKVHTGTPNEHSMHHSHRGFSSNFLVRVALSGLDSAKRTLQLDKMGGVLGNAAVFALSMLALLHLQQVNRKGNLVEIGLKQDRSRKNYFPQHTTSTNMQLSHLDVRLARG